MHSVDSFRSISCLFFSENLVMIVLICNYMELMVLFSTEFNNGRLSPLCLYKRLREPWGGLWMFCAGLKPTDIHLWAFQIGMTSFPPLICHHISSLTLLNHLPPFRWPIWRANGVPTWDNRCLPRSDSNFSFNKQWELKNEL